MTGKHTEFGKFISTIAYTNVVGHFEMVFYSFSLFFLAVSLFFVSFIMAVFASVRFRYLSHLGFGSCCGGVSPISMQVECTSTMALGSRALAKKQAIVSRLASIETLAGMDRLCSGKTGTLTLYITTIESKLPWGRISEQQWSLLAFLATRWTQYAKRIWTVTQVSTRRLSCRTGNNVDADGVGPSAFQCA